MSELKAGEPCWVLHKPAAAWCPVAGLFCEVRDEYEPARYQVLTVAYGRCNYSASDVFPTRIAAEVEAKKRNNPPFKVGDVVTFGAFRDRFRIVEITGTNVALWNIDKCEYDSHHDYTLAKRATT